MLIFLLILSKFVAVSIYFKTDEMCVLFTSIVAMFRDSDDYGYQQRVSFVQSVYVRKL